MQTLFEMMKRPEVEEANKSTILNQINSRIQSVLDVTGNIKRNEHSNNINSSGYEFDSNYKSTPRKYPEDSGSTLKSPHPSSNNTSSTQSQKQNFNCNLTAWEQFEAMKRQDYSGISEEIFLRDLIYVLQGLEGNLLIFSTEEGRYVVNDRLSVARPIRSLVEKLGRIGSDYRFLQNQIGVHREGNGILRQSFCRAMACELAEYLKLVAYLESSLNEKEKEEMSLKKAVYWFHEAGILLTFLKELVKDTTNLRGGALLSFLEQFRQHGNDQIRSVITRILDQMMLPYGEMLQAWLGEGCLKDPFDEFFIAEIRSVRSFEFDGSEFWNQKFVLRLSELPKFIPETLARRALAAGKTRKFIQAYIKNPPVHLRYKNSISLNVVENGEKAESLGMTTVLRDNLLESMEKEMKMAYKLACRQVRRILIEDCKLIEQVRCIKQYVLLSKGDFSMNLLELLWDGLNRPAGSLFRHNLVGVLESSIDSTRDPKEPEWLLANLDVRLLSNDQISGSGSSATGWEVFALDYRISFPVDCVLDPQSMQEYSKLSRYIWGLKRLEAVLSRSWQNLRTAQNGVSKARKRELRSDLRKMELLQYEMISFVRQALSVSFETISREWEIFENKMQKISTGDSVDCEDVDLDFFISIHRQFLENLKIKLRLWVSPAMRSKMSVISLGILRFESVQGALVELLTKESEMNLNFDLTEWRSVFQSAARHFQTDLDDLFMTLQKESALSSDSGASSIDLVSRLDFNEYHRRRNGFDSRKYL